jgi:integrase
MWEIRERKMGNLTAKQVRDETKQGRFGDGGGLYLYVAPTGTKSWVQRIVVDGKRVDRGLGGYPTIPLAKARKLAITNKAAVSAGRNPWAENARPVEVAKPAPTVTPTFREAALRVHVLQPFKSDKAKRNWWQTLDLHIIGKAGQTKPHHIGNVPVDELTRPRLIAALEPVWFEHAETGRKVRQRMRKVLDWCVEREYIVANPERGITSLTLPPKSKSDVEHRAALHYSEVTGAIRKMRFGYGLRATVRAFEFLVYTAARTSEVRFMTWNEVDLESGVWEISAERMKASRPHKVPLSSQAIGILREMRHLPDPDAEPDDVQTMTEITNGYVFRKSDGKPLSDAALLMRAKKDKLNCSVHGFRSSFADWARECSGASWEAVELSLAHAVGTSVSQAYFRSPLLDERRELLQKWADYVDPPLF